MVKKWRSWKLTSDKPCIEEFTVFIRVKIDSLNDFSKEKSNIVKSEVKIKSDKINIITDKK